MVDIVKGALLAFARLHVLHHASEEPIFGLGMMDELRRHGYRMGPGTLYPLLHRLDADGLLASRVEVVGGKVRKYYVITGKGRKVLRAIAPKIAELAEEVLPDPSGARTAGKGRRPGQGHGRL
jgi:DNA-binding PadR family transcriptional regulator